MLYYALSALAGAIAGGSAIGWWFWNRKAEIQKKYDELVAKLPG